MPYREVSHPVDYPGIEKHILEFWETNRIFQKSVNSRPEDRPFVFYEGPPTANGKPGIHHVISRCIKDFVCRYQTMKGFRVERKAGWDTHGLPVEIEVEKQLGIQTKGEIETYGVAQFNQKCRESVFKYLSEWNELTRRIGYWVDLDHPYITYTNEYIESVWWLLAQLHRKDFLYQGFKILPYCPRCETALSSHEMSLGYRDVKDRTITAKFQLESGNNRFILAWTTTPWTLPGNVALAVGPDIDYVEVEQETPSGTEIYYLAESRLEILKGEYRVIRRLTGEDMEGWTYRPLFDFINLADDKHPAYRVATADFVTTEEGTGVVHTAVMYGEDDYQLGMRIGLPAVHTVDQQGRFNENVPPWKGRYVKDPEVEADLIRYLKENHRLYGETWHTHSYPHCWRCDFPLLYYAKKSWYLRTTRIKDKLLENNKQIRWFPKEVGEGRFGQWLESNVDWALSRDRYWGTPLNVWVCESCGKQHAVESVEELKRLSGQTQIEDLHKPYIDEIDLPCAVCGGTSKRTPEVIDCWFDSGAMPYAQFHYPFEKESFEKSFPADFIAEGIDQTRGWFYSLLAISTMVSDQPSYKSCVSIELILDKNGQKMSKSRGNAVDPYQIINAHGADALRWYLFTVSPPWTPTRFDEEGVTEVIRKFFGTWFNTYSFFVLYANIDGFHYSGNAIPIEQRPEIDRWLISARNALVQRVGRFLERYDVTRACRDIQEFVIEDLSNWYVRRNRRRFWKSEPGPDKTAAYETLFETLFSLAKLAAPFTPFLAEDMYRNMNVTGSEPFESVHLAAYPNPETSEFSWRDEKLEETMRVGRELVSLCRSLRNDARIRVRQPLARVILHVPAEIRREAILAFEPLILEEINVRRIEWTVSADSLVKQTASPIFKKLGPQFGSAVNMAAEAIRALSPHEVARLSAGESLTISADGKTGIITQSDVEIGIKPLDGFQLHADGDWTVALDTVLNEDLIGEGLARELVNRLQNMRKEADFQVTDRIAVFMEAGQSVRSVFETRGESIRDEVLAASIQWSVPDGAFVRDWDIDGNPVRIGILRENS